MNYLKAFLIAILLSITSLLSAQTNQSKIIGTWTFDKFDFLKPDSDSLDMIKDAMGTSITFSKEGKYSTTQEIGGNVKNVESGTYSISSDGKTITQQDQNGEIIKLTDQELVLKVESDLVIHFKRVESEIKKK